MRCGFGAMYLTDANTLRHLASKGPAAEPVTHVETLRSTRLDLRPRADRAADHPGVRHAGRGTEFPLSHEIAQRLNHRTVVVVPLFREGKPSARSAAPAGSAAFQRARNRLAADFRRQAAIAIENDVFSTRPRKRSTSSVPQAKSSPRSAARSPIRSPYST